MLYTTMIMTFTVGVDLGFVLGCFLLIFYHIASMKQKLSSRPSERKVCPNFPLEPAERKVLERGKEGGLEGGGEVERRSEGQ